MNQILYLLSSPRQLIVNPLELLQHFFHNPHLIFPNQHLHQTHQMPIESPFLSHQVHYLALFFLTHKRVGQGSLDLLIVEQFQEPLNVLLNQMNRTVALSYV